MKSSYRLKQSPRAWFERLSSTMKAFSYKQSNLDHTLSIKHKEGKVTTLILLDSGFYCLRLCRVIFLLNCNSRILNELGVLVMELDLLCLSSVYQFIVEWENHSKPLRILINNAGILRMEEFSKDELVQHLQVNRVAPTQLTLLLIPFMLKATSSRVVNVNSLGKIEEHKYSGMKAYGTNKLVNVRTTLTLLFGTSIQCVALPSGIFTSNLVPGVRKKSFWMLDSSEGARSVIYSATSKEVVGNMVKGFVYYLRNCKPAKVSPQAENMEACLDVWEETLSILSFTVNYPSNIEVS
ncbi:hypothetical protein UlMin_013960 [Ulmus minor]